MSSRPKTYIVLGVLILIAIGGYICPDSIFPKAADVFCPEAEDITSIMVVKDGKSSSVDMPDQNELLRYIRSAQPTRKQSVNDTPAVKTYYLIRIKTSEPEYFYYAYESGSHAYIEIPYQGIYKAEQNAIVFLSEQFPGE